MTERKSLHLNEVFCSVQGEGIRAGTLNFFARTAFCNMECDLAAGPLSPGGFACDSEFASFRDWTKEDLLAELQTLNAKCKSIIWTGGEPGLQLTPELVAFFHDHGYYQAIETNGSIDVTGLGLDWITVSPKVAEHAIRCKTASEVKYVRGHGQGIPRPACIAEHKLISPAFNGMDLDRRAMAWCLQLIHENPEWRISVQMHKTWLVR